MDSSNWKFLSLHVRADHLMLDYRLIFLPVSVSLCQPPVWSLGFAVAKDQTWVCSAKDFQGMTRVVMGKAAVDNPVV